MRRMEEWQEMGEAEEMDEVRQPARVQQSEGGG
jgi:hypothetical protein